MKTPRNFKEFYTYHVKKCPTEEVEQIDAANWTHFNYPDLFWFHTPNEGNDKVQHRAKLIEMGMLPGIGDFVILSPGERYNFAVIELKRRSKSVSRLSQDQINVLNWVNEIGGYAAVAYGAKEYKKALQEYIGSAILVPKPKVSKPLIIRSK